MNFVNEFMHELRCIYVIQNIILRKTAAYMVYMPQATIEDDQTLIF